MPEPTPLRVCVLALTRSQHRDILNRELAELLETHAGTYNIRDRGYVYGDTPDEWAPFEDRHSITQYLSESGFEVTSLSRFISTCNELPSKDALVTQVDLYIFDPLFLALEGEPNHLIRQLEGVIRNGQKPFCVVFPSRLPERIAEILAQVAEEKLGLLKLAYERDGQGEWPVESSNRLRGYLSRLRRRLRPSPDPRRINEARNILQILGIPDFDIMESPQMLGGQ